MGKLNPVTSSVVSHTKSRISGLGTQAGQYVKSFYVILLNVALDSVNSPSVV